jgi:hypothetical protein
LQGKVQALEIELKKEAHRDALSASKAQPSICQQEQAGWNQTSGRRYQELSGKIGKAVGLTG